MSSKSQNDCTPTHQCEAHSSDHQHDDSCGHKLMTHGDHKDYVVGDHLHHPHGNHCDDHGAVSAGK